MQSGSAKVSFIDILGATRDITIWRNDFRVGYSSAMSAVNYEPALDRLDDAA